MVGAIKVGAPSFDFGIGSDTRGTPSFPSSPPPPLTKGGLDCASPLTHPWRPTNQDPLFFLSPPFFLCLNGVARSPGQDFEKMMPNQLKQPLPLFPPLYTPPALVEVGRPGCRKDSRKNRYFPLFPSSFPFPFFFLG